MRDIFADARVWAGSVTGQLSTIVIDESTEVSGASIAIKMAAATQSINRQIHQYANLFANMPAMPWPVSPQQKYADMNEAVLADRMLKNRVLGEAMHAVKWHGLKHYLTLDQRRKQRMRVQLERDRKAQRLMDEYRVILFTTRLENKNEQATG